jgi:hypothetical protein
LESQNDWYLSKAISFLRKSANDKLSVIYVSHLMSLRMIYSKNIRLIEYFQLWYPIPQEKLRDKICLTDLSKSFISCSHLFSKIVLLSEVFHLSHLRRSTSFLIWWTTDQNFNNECWLSDAFYFQWKQRSEGFLQKKFSLLQCCIFRQINFISMKLYLCSISLWTNKCENIGFKSDCYVYFKKWNVIPKRFIRIKLSKRTTLESSKK